MARVVVTGATGCIGRALVQQLIQRGDEILILSHQSATLHDPFFCHPQIKIKVCDLTTYAQIKNDSDERWDVFFHLAWQGTTGAARHDVATQQLNVQAAIDALALAQRFGCAVFVGAGSQAEYGIVNGTINELTPVNPITAYGKAKLKAGQLITERAKQIGMKSVWARICSVYGPYDDYGMISNAIKDLLSRGAADFTLATQIWNYLYCDDAAKALIKLATSVQGNQCYVLGHPVSQPLKQYIITLQQKVNPAAKLNFGVIPCPAGGVVNLRVDVTKLQNDTSWQPETDFTQGIEKTRQYIHNKYCQ